MQSNNLKHDLNHTHNFNDLCRVGSEIQLPEFPKIVLAIILNSVPSILNSVLKTMTLSTQLISITRFYVVLESVKSSEFAKIVFGIILD